MRQVVETKWILRAGKKSGFLILGKPVKQPHLESGSARQRESGTQALAA